MSKHTYISSALTEQEKQERLLLLEYEISSRWWTGYIESDWLKKISGNYFVWLINRKYKRFREYRYIKNKINGRRLPEQ